MPIEPSQPIAAVRPVGASDARVIRTAAGVKDQTAAAPDSSSASSPVGAATFQPSDALDPGQAPVDAERVEVIRKAIASGTYPVVPAKIADAIIAAGLLLRIQP
jgi:negative regulator of flagellin synthesis FlgM